MYTGDEKSPTKSKVYQIQDKNEGVGVVQKNLHAYQILYTASSSFSDK